MKTLRIAENVIWTHVGSLLQLVIGLLLPPFLIENVGESSYGIYALGLSLGGFIGVANLGLYDASSRYISNFNSTGRISDIHRVVSTMLSFYTLAAVVMTGICWVGCPFFVRVLGSIPAGKQELAVLVFRIFALNFGFSLLRNNLISIPQALQRFDLFSLTLVTGYLLTAVFSCAAVVLGFGLPGIAFGFTLATCASLIFLLLAMYFSLPQVKLGFTFDSSMFKLLMGFGFFTWISWFFYQIIQMTPRMMIGGFSSLQAVTAFSVPENLSMRAKTMIRQTGFVLLPRFSAESEPESHRELLRCSSWFMLASGLAFFIPAALLVPAFLSVWVSPEFAMAAAAPAQLICFSQMFCGAEYPFQSYLKGRNRPGLPAAYAAAVMLTLLGVAVWAIPLHGALGAAICLFSYIPWLVVGLTVALISSGTPCPLKELGIGFALPAVITVLHLIGYNLILHRLPQSDYPGLVFSGALMCAGILISLTLAEIICRGRDRAAPICILRHLRWLK